MSAETGGLKGEARRKLIDKIRALLSKTVERGCTEAEAVSAAAMASKLLDQYDIERDELTPGEAKETYREAKRPTEDPVGQRLWMVASAIAKLTGAKSFSNGASRRTLSFFGRDCDVMVAEYLLDICEGAMRRAFAEFRRTVSGFFRETVRRRHETGFLNGMATRLRDRLLEIHAARQATSTGRDLITSKDAELAQAMRSHGYVMTTFNSRVRVADDGSYDLGVDKANEIALNDGVAADAKDGMLADA